MRKRLPCHRAPLHRWLSIRPPPSNSHVPPAFGDAPQSLGTGDFLEQSSDNRYHGQRLEGKYRN